MEGNVQVTPPAHLIGLGRAWTCCWAWSSWFLFCLQTSIFFFSLIVLPFIQVCCFLSCELEDIIVIAANVFLAVDVVTRGWIKWCFLGTSGLLLFRCFTFWGILLPFLPCLADEKDIPALSPCISLLVLTVVCGGMTGLIPFAPPWPADSSQRACTLLFASHHGYI